jgi:hypothetical protein
LHFWKQYIFTESFLFPFQCIFWNLHHVRKVQKMKMACMCVNTKRDLCKTFAVH